MNLAELFRHETNLVTIPAGQTIIRLGEPSNIMYVIMQGSADVLVGNHVLETAGPGSLLGEMSLIDQGERIATVVARNECRLVPIDSKRFDFLIQQTPNFARHVMKVMADRIRRMDSKMLEITMEKRQA